MKDILINPGTPPNLYIVKLEGVGSRTFTISAANDCFEAVENSLEQTGVSAEAELVHLGAEMDGFDIMLELSYGHQRAGRESRQHGMLEFIVANPARTAVNELGLYWSDGDPWASGRVVKEGNPHLNDYEPRSLYLEKIADF